jgi:hypothetical protein
MRNAKFDGNKRGQLNWSDQKMVHHSVRHREGARHSWDF